MSNGSPTLGRTFLFFTTRLLVFSGRQEVTTIVRLTVMDNPRLIYLNYREKELKDNLYHRIGAVIFQNFCPPFWDLVEGSFSQVVT